jgi:cyclin-dependent kinase 14
MGLMLTHKFNFQLNPDNRIGAEAALKHPYFAQLPRKLYELPDGKF